MRLRNMEYFMPILGLALLGLVAGSPILENDKLDKQMTGEEMREVFNSEGPDLPVYEDVPIHLQKSSETANDLADRVRVEAFGRNVDLQLIPNDEVLIGKNTPVWFLKKDNDYPGGFRYVGALDMEEVENPLENEKSQASLIVKQSINEEQTIVMGGVQNTLENEKSQALLIVKQSSNAEQTISGHIGSEGWFIKSVPDRLGPQYNQEYQSPSAADSNPVYNFVYKTPPVPIGPEYFTSTPNEEKVKENIAGDRKSRMNHEVDVVYPQILLFIDNMIYERTFKRDKTKLLEYLVLYWNSVDLRFRNLEGPKVRLNIAGIVIADQPNVPPLAYNVTTDEINHETLADGCEILKMLGQHTGVNEMQFDPNSYDIAFFMMPYVMFTCSPYESSEPRCTGRALGTSYSSGSCQNVSSTGEPFNWGAAVVQDNGYFESINIAAHELGNLFGTVRYGEADCYFTPTHPTIPPADARLAKDGSQWSQFKINNMKSFLRRAACFYDKPTISSALRRFLPGDIYSQEKHCAMAGSGHYYSEADNSCLYINCIKKEADRSVMINRLSTLDGTACGNNGICYKGKCVDKRDAV